MNNTITRKEFEKIYKFFKEQYNISAKDKWPMFFMTLRSYKFPFEWVREVEQDLINDGILQFKVEEQDLVNCRVSNDGSIASTIQRHILNIMRQYLGEDYYWELQEKQLDKTEKQE